MKRNKLFTIFATVFLLSVTVCLSSCGKNGGDTPTPPEPEKPEPEIPAWDKSKTATVYFASKLKDSAIASTSSAYQKLGDYLAKKTFHAALINRSDVNIGEKDPINGGAICAFTTTKTVAFAAFAYNDNKVEGTSILLDSIVTQQETDFSGKLKMKNVSAKITASLDLPLATLHIGNKEQATAFSAKLSDIYTSKLLIIGTISASLYDSLEVAVKSSGKKLRLEKVKTEANADYALFILSPHYWLLRETTVEKSEENIPVYCLQIETNVFY